MARNEERIQTTDKKNETVTVLGVSAGVPDVTLPPVTDDHRVKASAVTLDADELPVAPEATYGMVLETKLVHCNRAGGRVTMRAGKIISSKDFDLAHLAQQGLKMRRHVPDAAVPLDQIFVD